MERTVALVFSDIVGSSAQNERLGDRRWVQLLQEHEQATQVAVDRHGGAIVKNLGDGFMLAFPSARAAIGCAVGIQEAVAEAPLEVRVGVHVGEATERDGDYFGRDVAIAARVAAAAGAREVLVSDVARALATGAQVSFGPVRAVALKGFPGLHDLHPVVWRGEQEAPPSQPAPPAHGDLLERDRELVAVDRLLAAVCGGEAGILVLEGPPGIGKTTLLRRARERAGAAGMRVLSARGSEIGGSLAFGALRQLLVPVIRQRGDDQVLRGPMAVAARALGFTEGEGAIEPAAVADALHWLIADLAEERPVALIVDDLHWVDEGSRLVLAQLCGQLHDVGVAVVIGTWPEPRLARDLHTILAAPGAREMRPAPLSERAVAVLAGRMLGTEEVAPAFAAACHEVTGGVPFLLHELLQSFAEQRLDPVETHAAQVREVAPRAVQRSVLVRLSRTSEDAIALARAVAVLQPNAEVPIAARVAGLDDEQALQAVRALVGAHVLEDRDDLDFLHSVMRRAVLGDMVATDLAALHRRAVSALRERGAPAEDVAQHLLQTPPAGDEETVRVLEEAGRQARAAGAADSAVDYLRRAVAEAEPSASLLAQYGRALAAIGDAEALQTLQAAHERSTSPDARGSVALDLAESLAFVHGRPEAGLAVLWEAAEALPAAHDQRYDLLARAFVLANRAGLYGERLRAAGAIPRGLTGATAAERACLCVLAGHWTDDRSADEVLATIEPAVSHPEFVTGDAPGATTVRYGIAVLRTAGQLTRADRLAAEMTDHCQRNGAPAELPVCLANRSALLYRLGRLAEAEAHGAEAYAMAGRDPSFASAVSAGRYALVLVARDRLDEAGSVLAQAAAYVGKEASIHLTDARAALCAARGDIRGAIDFELSLRELQVAAGLVAADDEWGHQLAIWLASAGRVDEAREIIELITPGAERYGVPTGIGWVMAARGFVERDADLARQGAEILAGTEYALEHARAVVNLGRIVRRKGFDREAREHLREGLELARGMGARLLAREAEDELRAAGGRSRKRALSGVESLTPSELRIVQLAAAGATNREIAEQLYLTIKTVEMHLRNAFRKLDVASRKDLPGALAA